MSCGPGASRRGAGAGASSSTTWAFAPPMPKELTPARRGPAASQGRSAAFTTKGLAAKSIRGLGRSKPRLGASVPWRSISAVLISPATPAATSRWPMLVLTEPSAQKPRRAVPRRKARVSAAASIGSPSAVPVPWAST